MKDVSLELNMVIIMFVLNLSMYIACSYLHSNIKSKYNGSGLLHQTLSIRLSIAVHDSLFLYTTPCSPTTVFDLSLLNFHCFYLYSFIMVTPTYTICIGSHRLNEPILQVRKNKSWCILQISIITRLYSARMAIPKTCNVCGVTLNCKSNLNRHIIRFHSTRKKNALNKKTHKRQSSKLQLRKKKSSSSINVDVLNTVPGELLLTLVKHKDPTVNHQEQC